MNYFPPSTINNMNVTERRPDQGRLTVLLQELDKVHLAYIHQDHSPQKMKDKCQLEALIMQFLSIVPPQAKYVFPATRQILYDTIKHYPDFHCYQAIQAWNGIAMYAHNLLTQPWRKEFRTIQMFNGYYAHNIDKLVGGDVMLQIMGYRKVNRAILVMENPYDRDTVVNISKDALVAAAECQIMRAIFGGILSVQKDTSWMEIFAFRETYVGTIEQAVSALSFRGNPYNYGYNPSAFYVHPVAYYHMPHITMPMPQFIPAPQQFISRLDRVGQPCARGGYLRQYPVHQVAGHGHGSANYPIHYVPTGQLIQLDSAPPQPTIIPQQHQRPPAEHVASSSGIENSSYHLRAVERSIRSSQPLETEPVNINRAQTTTQIDNEVPEVPPSSPQTLECSPCLQNEARASGNVDDLNVAFNGMWKSCREQKKKKKESRKIIFSSFQPICKVDLPLKSDSQWNCQFCTFLNNISKEVCEMCGKSKFLGAEIPLTSGGRQCPKCTLVNDRGANDCEACGASLKDSPTYI